LSLIFANLKTSDSLDMRRIIIIVLPVVLLLGTLTAVVLFVRSRGGAPALTEGGVVPPSGETIERARSALEQALEACAGDSDCVTETTRRYAILSQAAELCRGIEDSTKRDSCLDDVAFRQLEPAICDQITDEGRLGLCRDNIVVALTLEVGDLAGCGKVKALNLLENCLRRLLANSSDQSRCQGLSDQAGEMCGALVIMNQAAEKNDSSLCDQIADLGLRSVCAGGGEDEGLEPFEFVPLDSDEDGLSDQDERHYGTNRLDPDTDGDGFDDGTEVKNGFNPLGEGRL